MHLSHATRSSFWFMLFSHKLQVHLHFFFFSINFNTAIHAASSQYPSIHPFKIDAGFILNTIRNSYDIYFYISCFN